MVVAEAKFLKAYFHCVLLRMSGPIPIMDKNLPSSVSASEAKVFRQPVDSVVNYIAGLLDEAAAGDMNTGLPSRITSLSTDLGRVTQPEVLALKARMLVTAPSQWFNGNTDFAHLKNPEGTHLFISTLTPGQRERDIDAS